MGWKWFKFLRAPAAGAPDASALGEGAPYYDTTLKTLFVSNGVNWKKGDADTIDGVGLSQLIGFKNRIINGRFAINQRSYVSGAALPAGLYGHDRWRGNAAGDTYTFSTTNNKTTVTIPSDKVLRQTVEGLNLQSGTYTLSWEGTALGKIGGGTAGDSGITGTIVGGTNTIIEFGPGTLANVQFEFGAVATPFEDRLYGTELALCQRYGELYVVQAESWHAIYNGSSFTSVPLSFMVEKRISPSGTLISFSSAWRWVIPGVIIFSANDSTGVNIDETQHSFHIQQLRVAGEASPTSGNVYVLEPSSTFFFDAEF